MAFGCNFITEDSVRIIDVLYGVLGVRVVIIDGEYGADGL